MKHPDKNNKDEKGCFIGVIVSFLFISGEENSRWQSERRENMKPKIGAFWAQMANYGKLGAVPTWDWNIPHISSNANIPLLWMIELFNCAEENLTRHLLNTYPVHCALKPYCEKLTMKMHGVDPLRNRFNRKKIHKWWSRADCKVHNRKLNCTPWKSGENEVYSK